MSNEMMSNIKEKFDDIKDEGNKKIHRMSTKYPKIGQDDTALIIIDVQERLAPAMEFADESIKNINVLIEMAKTYDMPIIATEQYPAGLGHTLKELSNNFNDEARVFEKINYSAYEDIKDYLEETGKSKIVMTGMETHVCVYQTARDLKYNGYDVYIAKDAVDSRFKVNFENALELMRDMGIHISNTETILFDAMEKAGTLEFKKLSKLIK